MAPLQTYRDYIQPRQSNSVQNALGTMMQIKGMNALTAEREAAREERKEDRETTNALTNRRETRLDEAHKTEQNKAKRDALATAVKGIRTDNVQNFMEDWLLGGQRLGEAVIAAHGDTPKAAQIIDGMKKIRDKIMPQGQQGPPDLRAAEDARKYIKLVQDQLLEPAKPTPEKTADLEVETYLRKKKGEKNLKTPEEKALDAAKTKKFLAEADKINRTPGHIVSGKVYQDAVETKRELEDREVGFIRGALTPGVSRGDSGLSKSEQSRLDAANIIEAAYLKQAQQAGGTAGDSTTQPPPEATQETIDFGRLPSDLQAQIKSKPPGTYWMGESNSSTQEAFKWDGKTVTPTGETREKGQKIVQPPAPAQAPPTQQQPMSTNERSAAAKEELAAVLEAMDRGQLDMKAVNAKVLEIADKYKINQKTLASILQTPGPGLIERGVRKIGRTVADTTFGSTKRFE